jgi:hypothetical protein
VGAVCFLDLPGFCPFCASFDDYPAGTFNMTAEKTDTRFPSPWNEFLHELDGMLTEQLELHSKPSNSAVSFPSLVLNTQMPEVEGSRYAPSIGVVSLVRWMLAER